MTTSIDAEFDAAAMILRAPMLERRCAEHIIDERSCIDFTPILRQVDAWSHGEQILVKAALDMWNGTGHCTLDEIITTLDEGNFALVLAAIMLRRGSS